MALRTVAILTGAFVLLAPSLLEAQRRMRPTWVLTVSGGGGGDGPSESLANHLARLEGFSDRDVCFLESCVSFPRFRRPTLQWYLALGRPLRGVLGMRAFAGAGELGWAAGEGDSGSINWHWSARMAGLQMTVDLPVMMFGDAGWAATFAAGPMLARVASGRGLPKAYPSDSLTHVTRFGMQFNALGYMYPSERKRWFFFGIEFGYRFLRGRAEGPYDLDTGAGALPAFQAQYKHLYAGSFIGLRFRSF